ncbi:uncharacterized protein METZ01_LOCUS337041 [marine metagenome]|uniref:Uncharacterized protein n=1 Tax=marine metagenome TaxID=408172 RepID=A0A382QGQ9_9ZZZZ
MRNMLDNKRVKRIIKGYCTMPQVSNCVISPNDSSPLAPFFASVLAARPTALDIRSHPKEN